MTHSAAEVFTMQLARAAAKQANKFLHARDLSKADRDDVVGAAMLWCWANRARYSLTTTLETWFMNAVRDAYKRYQRNELPTSDESVEMIGGADDTYDTAAAASSMKTLLDALTPTDKKIVQMTIQGYTYKELLKLGYSNQSISVSRQRVRQLRRLMPDGVSRRPYADSWVTAATPSSDDADDKLSGIDMELEQLEFAPPAGKDCPPCWRCAWFEGFMPTGKRETRMEIQEAEVRAAVKSTEARKIEIAKQVRSNTWR